MCKTIKQKVKFKAPPLAIYELLVNAKRHEGMTGKRAANPEKVGAPFTSYGGHVTGINVDLLRGKRIVQAWRERAFPEGIYSMATFNLTATRDGGTDLVLTHRGVPKDLIPRIEREWREHYWEKMKRFVANCAESP